jgi:histidinol-phosphate aminotransferase
VQVLAAVVTVPPHLLRREPRHVVDIDPLTFLLKRHPDTLFLIDEAFIGLAGVSAVSLVPQYKNVIVTRTFSKAHSLAGLRVGYAAAPLPIADDLNGHNDAYPLARPSEAAALATRQNDGKIHDRAATLRRWTGELATGLRALGSARSRPKRTSSSRTSRPTTPGPLPSGSRGILELLQGLLFVHAD